MPPLAGFRTLKREQRYGRNSRIDILLEDETKGSVHVEVYIAGTDAQAPMGGEQPWDMASNVAIIAGAEASSMQAVRAALAAANANSPKGAIEVGDQRYQIYSNDQARVADEYRSLIIAWRNGAPVRLSDVAEVIDSPALTVKSLMVTVVAVPPGGVTEICRPE